MPAALPVSVTPAVSSPAAASSPRSDGGDANFSRHLDAARQPRDSESSDHQAPASGGGGHDTPTGGASTDTAATPAKQPSKGKQGDLEPPLTLKEKADDPSAAPSNNPTALATALLALLGHAPAAAVSAAAGGAAKVLAAGSLKVGVSATGVSSNVPTRVPSKGLLDEPSGDGAATATATAAAGNCATAASADMPGAAGSTALVQQAATALGAGAVSTFDPALSGGAAHKGERERGTSDLAALLPAGPASNGATAIGSTHALQMSSPAGSAAFAQELGQHVAWLGGQDIKQARIHLHPEELGQLDVKVSVLHTGQVDVTFAAQHPAAVHVVQQTLPQLDALLAQHGLSLGQAEVGQRHADGDRQPGQSGGGAGGDAIDEAAAVAGTSTPAVSAIGLLDMFA